MSDLSELFARDPQKLTDPDIDKIIARMREAQSNYELAVPKAKVVKPKSAKTLDLLKDLGLV